MSQEPQIQQRAGLRYAAVPRSVTMKTLDGVVEQEFARLFEWLDVHGVEPAGSPFIRFLVIDMMQDLQIELAVPVDGQLEEDELVRSGSLPGGDYVVLRHTGSYDGLLTDTGQLLDWADQHDIDFDVTKTAAGDAWAGRVETYVIGRSTEPDPDKWQTDIAMKIRA